jgi:hypothetical protein
MENKQAIDHLDRVATSIEEAIWLIRLCSDRPTELTSGGDFLSRMSERLIEHLANVIETIHETQVILIDGSIDNAGELSDSATWAIETARSINVDQSSHLRDSPLDRSPNTSNIKLIN